MTTYAQQAGRAKRTPAGSMCAIKGKPLYTGIAHAIQFCCAYNRWKMKCAAANGACESQCK